MFLLDSDNNLTLPSCEGDDRPRIIALGAILKAEAKQQELSHVTKEKAPYLLQVYNSAWRELHKVYSQLRLDKLTIEKMVDRRRSTLLLGEVPRRLKELDIASTADTRQAVIELDQEYARLIDIQNQIEAAYEYIGGKLKSFENAFTAVKKIMSEDTYNMLSQGHDGTSGGISDDAEIGMPVSKFGKVRY